MSAGGWDAWNVTEDADLGLRLARGGQRVGVIAPPTRETPPEALLVWVNQRSRWLKGFLQTWLVVMRQPLAALGPDAPGWTDFGGSVGEAYYPDDGRDADALLKKADRRMYNLKFQHRAGEPAFPLRRRSDPKD